MAEKDLLVGIDIGGTTVKAALISMEGEIISQTAVRTGIMQSEDELAKVAQSILAVAGDDVDRVADVGLAVPGVVSPEDKLTNAPNISLDLEGLMDELAKVFPGCGIWPVNDANAAALGELWKGAGAGSKNLVFITLGTGVGCGIVIDGKIVVGAHGAGGELGHTNVVEDGRQCNCGLKGCLEMYASSRGLVLNYKEHCASLGVEPVKLDHEAHALPIFEAARNGDAAATAAVADLAHYLARALSNVAMTIDPGVFVIGGGMSGAFDLFGPYLREHYVEWSIPACQNTQILPASLGNDAGALGAAYQALTKGKAQ